MVPQNAEFNIISGHKTVKNVQCKPTINVLYGFIRMRKTQRRLEIGDIQQEVTMYNRLFLQEFIEGAIIINFG